MDTGVHAVLEALGKSGELLDHCGGAFHGRIIRYAPRLPQGFDQLCARVFVHLEPRAPSVSLLALGVGPENDERQVDAAVVLKLLDDLLAARFVLDEDGVGAVELELVAHGGLELREAEAPVGDALAEVEAARVEDDAEAGARVVLLALFDSRVPDVEREDWRRRFRQLLPAVPRKEVAAGGLRFLVELGGGAPEECLAQGIDALLRFPSGTQELAGLVNLLRLGDRENIGRATLSLDRYLQHGPTVLLTDELALQIVDVGALCYEDNRAALIVVEARGQSPREKIVRGLALHLGVRLLGVERVIDDDAGSA